MVDIHSNPLYYAASGGLILGLSISLHYIMKGNVTGMSGILYGVASMNKKELPNKLAILSGMVFAGGLFFNLFNYNTFNEFTPFGPQDKIDEKTSFVGFGVAGFLVGLGTKLGNGCTSGHGLCGISRLSIRSLVAVIIFLACAFGMGCLQYYIGLGALSSEDLSPEFSYNHLVSANIFLSLGVVLPIVGIFLEKKYNMQQSQWGEAIRSILISWVVGLLFGLGLLVAGMCRRINILSFLWLGKDWNPSLLFVLGSGVLVGLISFNYMLKVRKIPIYGTNLQDPRGQIDAKLIVGSILFGLGWGIGGLCPGPAIVMLAIWSIPVHLIWFGCLCFGMAAASLIDRLTQKQEYPEIDSPSKLPISNQIANESISLEDNKKERYEGGNFGKDSMGGSQSLMTGSMNNLPG